MRYRCRVGHAYTANGVLDGKDAALEDALYAALYTLEEGADMAESLAGRSRRDDRGHAAARFEGRARESGQRAETIRLILTAKAAGG